MENQRQPTAWFTRSVVYHILIDRFSGGQTENWARPEFMGGNLNGITERLDDLQELGVNALWLSPFYQTTAYHGYHVANFYSVEPRFGTLDDLGRLIEAAHQRGMRIIADFVPNHCSREHPFFREARENRTSEYRDWFFFTKWPEHYLCFLEFPELPKINLDHAPARAHMIGAAKRWLELGVDGFRIDHVVGPSRDFLKVFAVEVKKKCPHAVLIGEAWLDGVRLRHLKTLNVRRKWLRFLFGLSPNQLYRDYIGVLDGVLDFYVQSQLRQYIKSARSPSDRRAFEQRISKHFSAFPSGYYLPVFLDNHDMDRFLYICGNDKELLKEASKILFSLNQPVIIYYGTEAGLTQNESIRSQKTHGDLLARQSMNWDKRDADLFGFFQELIKKTGMRG